MTSPGFIGTLGSFGIGLVWGWLIGKPGHRLHNSTTAVLSVLLSTMALAVQIVLFLDQTRLLFFLGAVPAAFVAHREWHRSLVRQKAFKQEKGRC